MAAASASAVSKVMITGVLIAAFIQTARGVRCYRCDSLVDPGCGDPFGTNFANLEDCAPNKLVDSTACLKLIQKTSDGKKITRRCLQHQEADDLIPRDYRDLPCMDLPDGSFLCHCYHDRCNGAPSSPGHVLFGFVITALTLLLRWLQE